MRSIVPTEGLGLHTLSSASTAEGATGAGASAPVEVAFVGVADGEGVARFSADLGDTTVTDAHETVVVDDSVMLLSELHMLSGPRSPDLLDRLLGVRAVRTCRIRAVVDGLE